MLWFKNLAMITISGKVLKDRAYEIAVSTKYDIKKDLSVWVFWQENRIVNENLAQESHKPRIKKKFERTKVYTRFKDNIWAADLARIRSLSSFNRSIKMKN